MFKYGVSTVSYKVKLWQPKWIFLANNPAYHSNTKHIDVQYHFVRDMIKDKKVLLVKVDTLKNTANALTKSVSFDKFPWCRETMGIVGLDKWLIFLVAPCGKKTISGRMLGCIIFFPQLAHIVNPRVRRGMKPALHCVDCVAEGVIGGLRGVGNPTLGKFWFWTLC